MRNERKPLPFSTERAGSFRRDDARLDPIGPGATSAERTTLNVVREWGQSIEFGDQYLRGHCARVAEHATALAIALGTSEEMRTNILVGSYLHGVGRLRVARSVLSKPGVLTLGERASVQEIPVWGTEILSKITLPWDVVPIVRWHNERLDGTGYPDGLRGREIPLEAQVVGISNVFVAMISPRPYRQELRPPQAVRELTGLRTRWRRDVFDTFLSQLQSLYSGSLRLA